MQDSRMQDDDDDFEEEVVEFCNGLPCVYLFALVIVVGVVLVGIVSSSVSLAFVVVLCLLPTALVAYMTYVRNHLDAVPPTAVIHSFCWGAIGSFPVLSIQILSVAYATGAWDLLGEPNGMPVDDDTNPDVSRALFFSFFQAYVVCAVTEESLKYIVVTQFPGPSLVSRPYGVVVLCIAAGLGLATMENLGYVLFDDSGVSYFVAIMRGFMDIVLHTVTAILIGVRIAVGDHEHYPFFRLMAIPLVVHGTYDLFLMIPSRLAAAYPLLNLFPLVSIAVTVAAGGFALKQANVALEYDIIGKGDAPPSATERHDRVL